MQLQFHKTILPCLQRLKEELQVQEETQELRITEDMPDVGSILGTWGQVLLRGKEWRSGSMELSCGVMVWVMYAPEDGGMPQMVEAWIPFSFKWDLPATERDGNIRVSCLVRSVDARATSARKLMLRATVSAFGEAWIPEELETSQPEETPENICLLKNIYPVRLVKEAGEKAFALDEDLTLPSSAPQMEKLLRFSLQPEVVEQKVMADKVVFRGAALLHILYQMADGSLNSWDFELPFSQYNDLNGEYGADAGAGIWMAVTSLELDQNSEGGLRLKAGLTGQYLISDRVDLELVEDAYSPHRSVALHKDMLKLNAILEEQRQTIHAEQTVPVEGLRIADTAFFPDQPRQNRGADDVEVELSAQFQMLYYGPDGTLQGTAPKWHGCWSLPADSKAQVQTVASPTGNPQGKLGTEATLRGDLLLDIQTTAVLELPVVTGMEIGEQTEANPERPSLILRRPGKMTLWEIAKAAGSTVEAIEQLNQLQGEPAEDRMLLIPVL